MLEQRVMMRKRLCGNLEYATWFLNVCLNPALNPENKCRNTSLETLQPKPLLSLIASRLWLIRSDAVIKHHQNMDIPVVLQQTLSGRLVLSEGVQCDGPRGASRPPEDSTFVLPQMEYLQFR